MRCIQTGRADCVFWTPPVRISAGPPAPTALLAAEIGDRIFQLGAKLPQFQLDIAVVLISALLLVYVPLLFFGTRLFDARWKGLREYGGFAAGYVEDFPRQMDQGDSGGESEPHWAAATFSLWRIWRTASR
jgi:hypothetical protein